MVSAVVFDVGETVLNTCTDVRSSLATLRAAGCG
jgi:hypothetical protein